jgi:hypothetical protein
MAYSIKAFRRASAVAWNSRHAIFRRCPCRDLPLDVIPPDRREGRFGSIGGANARRVMVDLVAQFADYCQKSQSLPLSAALHLPPEASPTFGH